MTDLDLSTAEGIQRARDTIADFSDEYCGELKNVASAALDQLEQRERELYGLIAETVMWIDSTEDRPHLETVNALHGVVRMMLTVDPRIARPRAAERDGVQRRLWRALGGRMSEKIRLETSEDIAFARAEIEHEKTRYAGEAFARPSVWIASAALDALDAMTIERDGLEVGLHGAQEALRLIANAPPESASSVSSADSLSEMPRSSTGRAADFESAGPGSTPGAAVFHVLDTRTGKPVDMNALANECTKAEWANDLIWCDLEDFAVEADGTLVLLDECGNYAYPPDGRFVVQWEQRGLGLSEDERAEVERLRADCDAFHAPFYCVSRGTFSWLCNLVQRLGAVPSAPTMEGETGT